MTARRAWWAGIEAPRRMRLGLRLVAIVLGAVFGFWAAVRLQEQDYRGALWVSLGVFLAALLEFIVADFVVEARYPPQTQRLLARLDRALAKGEIAESITNALERCVASFRGCGHEHISATVHLRVEVFGDGAIERRLVQATRYTRPRLGGPRWRFTDESVGLIGRCSRTGQVETVNFRDRAEYNLRMVEEFGFTRAAAARHTTTARSYLAFPVVEDGEVVAVLFFFSTEPQVFPRAVALDRIAEAGQEILAYLRVADVF